MQLVVDSTECQKYAQKEKLDLLRSSDTTLCYSLGNNNILEFTEEEKITNTCIFIIFSSSQCIIIILPVCTESSIVSLSTFPPFAGSRSCW